MVVVLVAVAVVLLPGLTGAAGRLFMGELDEVEVTLDFDRLGLARPADRDAEAEAPVPAGILDASPAGFDGGA